MNCKTNKLRDAVLFALIAGPMSGTALAQSTQQPAPAATDQAKTQQKRDLDTVTVTGSRIRQVDTETSQPVTFITRETIEKQGFQSVADILQNITSTGTPPISRAAPLSSGENVGGAYVSLRNLGAARTLVLINGQRLGVTTSGLADLATIPASAVERIEVQKDGASSTYGSDAIAGVINVITRKNLQGGIASVYYGEYDKGDGAIKKGDISYGIHKDKFHLLMSAEVRQEEGIGAWERDFSKYPRGPYHPTDGWTTVGQYGGFTTTATTMVPGVPKGTRVVLRPGGDPRNLADYRAQDTNTGTCTATGCTPGSIADKSNSLEQMSLRTPLKSKSFYANSRYDISERIGFSADVLYSQRTSSRMIAGYPYQAASFGTPMSAQSYYNPTGAAITNWWRRAWEQPRTTKGKLDTLRISAGFDGTFDIGSKTFNWDVGYLHNRNDSTQYTFGNLYIPGVKAAVGPSFMNAQGRVQCGTAANPIPFSSCVPWNPFANAGVTGKDGLTGNPELLGMLFQPETARGRTTTTVWSANITGPIFTLPAGDLALAFGLEHRKEAGQFVPDPLAMSGNSTNLSAGPTKGQYSVKEAYLEARVPLLKDKPLFHELTLNLATRYSDYDTFGKTNTRKYGFVWKPIDQLMFRGTIADGFRAPTIADLYGGSSQTFSSFTDPCDIKYGAAATSASVAANCKNGVGGLGALGALAANYRQLAQGFVPIGAPNTQTPVAFTSGSNPLLQPETSKTRTFGAVWSPPFLRGFNIALDYWKIRIESTIVGDSPTQILNDCYVQGIASRCATALFVRDPTLGIPVVSFGGRNAGYRQVEGYDLDLTYRWNSPTLGRFSIASNSTYTGKDVTLATNDPRYPISAVSWGSTFRVRSNLNLSWDRGIWGASWMVRYYSKMKESCTYFMTGSTTPNLECNEIVMAPTGAYQKDGVTPVSALSRRNVTAANMFHDVQARVTLPWKGTLAIGANNVFGHLGPIMYTQPSANVNYYGGFDIGRFIYMKYTQKF